MTKNNNTNTIAPDIDEQAEILLENFENNVKTGFGAILIMYSINKRGAASSKEIKKDMEKIFDDYLSYNYTSFYRLMNRMRDEAKLIVESSRKAGKGPDRIYYKLTPLGEVTLGLVFKRLVLPFSKLADDKENFINR